MTRPETSSPAVGSDVTRRDFIKGGIAAGAVAGGSMGAFYFGYNKAMGSPVRVAVVGTGDEGSVLIGAINPEFIEVKAIADIRPYNVWRAFHGDHSSPVALEARPGLMTKYGWKTEDEARRHVQVYDYTTTYEELFKDAPRLGIEAVIIALPLHLHAPCAMSAMQHGLHVITEKLMAHSVHECKQMARMAKQQRLYLAVGHQRHYNILYANAVDQIRRGGLGELHYVRAQWHRGNLPDHDSWKMPLPPGIKLNKDGKDLEPQTKDLLGKLKNAREELKSTGDSSYDAALLKVQQLEAQVADKLLGEKQKDGKTLAEQFGYEATTLKDVGDKTYNRPAIEELIRWRLWDRTAAGLMAELGSHQLDAASIFVNASRALAEDTAKPGSGGHDEVHPLCVVAAGNRPLFPADRDCEDHVYCILEFPAPGYDPQDPIAVRKKIGVQYASINGNGFGGYGEIVYGTKGTLILEREQEMTVVKSGGGEPSSLKVAGGSGGPTMDTQASGPQGVASKAKAEKVSRGYTEELEHWAWCIRHPSPENQPRCHAEKAMGDAIIALVTNMAAREGKPYKFEPAWFDVDKPDTPEGIDPAAKQAGAK